MISEYNFTLPIGDWSDDGHGKCDYYHVKSNKPIDEVREVHFQMREKLGFSVEDIACEYEDNSIPKETMDKIVELGFLDYIENNGGASLFDSCLSEWEGKWSVYSTGMAHLWVFMLMKTDEDLNLEIIKSPEMLPFYGCDSKRRHIDFVGYGCFY